jgi:hypothetical protein
MHEQLNLISNTLKEAGHQGISACNEVLKYSA